MWDYTPVSQQHPLNRSSQLQDLPGQEVFDCVVFGNVLCEVPDQEAAGF